MSLSERDERRGFHVCPYCGGWAANGTTCPRSVECPSCHAAPGSPCKRPSGHRAARLHTPRVELAERSGEIATAEGFEHRRMASLLDEGAAS